MQVYLYQERGSAWRSIAYTFSLVGKPLKDSYEKVLEIINWSAIYINLLPITRSIVPKLNTNTNLKISLV